MFCGLFLNLLDVDVNNSSLYELLSWYAGVIWLFYMLVAEFEVIR